MFGSSGPDCDDEDGDRQTWIWATEDDLTLSQHVASTDQDEAVQSSPAEGAKEERSVFLRSDILSSLYPMVNELPNEFPSMAKGKNWISVENQAFFLCQVSDASQVFGNGFSRF